VCCRGRIERLPSAGHRTAATWYSNPRAS
jgi:hypothetical protein